MELLMFLPLLVALWLLLLTVGSVGMTCPQGTAAAQRNVWGSRNETLAAREVAVATHADWGQMVESLAHPGTAEGGLRTSEVKFVPEVYIDSISERLPEGIRRSAVLGDPWDHRVIAFPTPQMEHQGEVTPLAAQFINSDAARRLPGRLLDYP